MNEGEGNPTAKKPSPLAHKIKFALAQQFVILVFAGMILDGGRIGQTFLFGLIAFWITVLLILFRRKQNLTKGDLVFIEGGSMVVCLLSALITIAIWRMRGVL